MTDAIFKIEFLPDLSMPKYMAKYGQNGAEYASRVPFDILGLLDDHREPWMQIHYQYEPKMRSAQERLKLFFQIHNEVQGKNKLSVPGGHLLTEFYKLVTSDSQEAMGSLKESTTYLFELQKDEELFFDEERDLLYYAPVPFSLDTSQCLEINTLDAMFHTLKYPCAVDISAKPMELPESLGPHLIQTIQEMDYLASAFNPERREGGSIEDLTRRRDLIAARHRDYYQQYFDQLFSGRVYEFTIRVASGDPVDGALISRAIGQAIIPNLKFKIVQYPPGKKLTATDNKPFNTLEHRIPVVKTEGNHLCYSKRLVNASKTVMPILPEKMQRCFNLSHLKWIADNSFIEKVFRFPVSEGIFLRTIRIESEVQHTQSSHHVQDLPGVSVGQEIDRDGSMKIGLDQIQKHMFIAGVTGSGKTTTILSLLKQLWEDHNIPFLVLEPAKSEYRTLLQSNGQLAKDLRIYTPGNERVSPFRFNPLEVPPGVTVEEHISSLEACFSGAVPMSGGPLPSLLSESIELCYASSGLSLADVDTENSKWPTMNNLVSSAKKIMEDRGYVGEVKSNLQTAIDVRLNSLCRRSVGRLFSLQQSFPTLDELLRYPTVLEMEGLNLDQQNLLMLFLLSAIREKISRKGYASELKHVIILEEAHNLIGIQNSNRQVSEDAGDPRGHAARFLVKMLAEVRALGEGILVIDQSPASIAPEVLKNTSIKIVHRTVSQDDRDALASAMLMDGYAHEELARLQVGRAFVYHEHLYRPILVHADNLMEGCEALSSQKLGSQISQTTWYNQGLDYRWDQLITKLDTVLALLGQVLGKIVKSARENDHLHEFAKWNSMVINIADEAIQKVNGFLIDTTLDKGLADQVSDLRSKYVARVAKILIMAKDQLMEVEHGKRK